MKFWIFTQRIADNDEEEVGDGDYQPHGETDGSLTSMCGDTKRHPDDCKRNTGKWKGKAFVYFRAAGAAFLAVLALQLLKQMLYRQSGTAGPLFFLLVQLLEADRQRAFRHIDSVPNLPQVQRILFVPRLIARLIEVH